MSSKYSSFKSHQLITESWRRHMAEDEGSLDPAAAAETPEVQELADVVEDDPKVQAALAAVMDELAAVEGLEEGFGQPESYRHTGSSHDPADAEALAGIAGAGVGGFGSLLTIAAVENTAAYAALLSALEMSSGAAAGVALPAAALGAVAGVLLMRKMRKGQKNK
jgi:hypothetical protein